MGKARLFKDIVGRWKSATSLTKVLEGKKNGRNYFRKR